MGYFLGFCIYCSWRHLNPSCCRYNFGKDEKYLPGLPHRLERVCHILTLNLYLLQFSKYWLIENMLKYFLLTFYYYMYRSFWQFCLAVKYKQVPNGLLLFSSSVRFSDLFLTEKLSLKIIFFFEIQYMKYK